MECPSPPASVPPYPPPRPAPRHVVCRSLSPALRSIKRRTKEVLDHDDNDAKQEAEEGEPEPDMVPLCLPCLLPLRALSHDPARAKVSAVQHPASFQFGHYYSCFARARILARQSRRIRRSPLRVIDLI